MRNRKKTFSLQSAPFIECTGTMLMHPCLCLRYARASLTNSQDLCPRGIVLLANCAICPMGKIVRVGLKTGAERSLLGTWLRIITVQTGVMRRCMMMEEASTVLLNYNMQPQMFAVCFSQRGPFAHCALRIAVETAHLNSGLMCDVYNV